MGDQDEDLASPGGPGWQPGPAWPEPTAFLPPGPASLGLLAPVGGGKLDLTLPWVTLAGNSAEPGALSRIGPVTAAQARCLAGLAARDPAVQWRVIVTDPDGRAVAAARLRARAGPAGEPAGPRRSAPAADGVAAAGDRVREAGLIRRVTVTFGAEALSRPPPATGHPVMGRLMRAALAAASRATELAEADASAPDGCAHTEASLAYRPPPRLWEFITVRDFTCRFPTCRQPAWRCDLDHTTPWDRGGRTCRCNLGGLCRHHHQLKQHLRWQLTQRAPGVFDWTTPTGRTYTTLPDRYAV